MTILQFALSRICKESLNTFMDPDSDSDYPKIFTDLSMDQGTRAKFT